MAALDLTSTARMHHRPIVVCTVLLSVLHTAWAGAQVPAADADADSPRATSPSRWRTSPLVPRPAEPLSPSPVQPCRLPSRTSTILLQAGGGLGGGFLGVTAAAVTVLVVGSARFVSSASGRSTDLEALIDFLAYPSYVLGSAAGVYWVGDARDHRGRFLPTLLGSALGIGAPGAVIAYHLSHSRDMAKDAACSPPGDPAIRPGADDGPGDPALAPRAAPSPEELPWGGSRVVD